ncbi:MAG: hypothetical protein KC449_08105 [Anaerolineales bacterium]|nr:hypothetical protein [Anaerolineales bacterium]
MVERRVSSDVKQSTSKWLTIWHWLFNVSLTAVFISLFIQWPKLLLRLRLAENNSVFRSGWLVLLVMSLLLLLTAMVHEVGHLLAGYWVRFRFQVLVVGPLRLSAENGRLRLQRQRGGSLFNGLAASLPQEMDNLARRLLYFALGGPLASLLFSLTCLVVALYLSNDLSRMLDYLWLWECCLFTAVVSYFFLLTSMRPGAYHNGMVADGGRILMLATKSAQAARWQMLVKLTVADLAGERPSLWDAKLLQQSLTPSENSHDYLTAVLMNFHHCLDKNAPQMAANFLEEALNLPVTWETGIHTRLLLEKAFLAAAFWADGQKAQALVDQLKLGRRQKDSLFWRTQAALYFLAGERTLARETAVRGLTLLEKERQTGRQKAELAWLKALMEKASDP